MKEYTAMRQATVNWLAIGAALAAGIAIAALAAPTGDVTLAWSYPTNLVAGVTFKVYGSPTLGTPMSSWPVIATVPGPTTNATVHIAPGAFFFSVTASNIWGESSFSNVAQTPALPLAPTVTIQAVQ